MEQWRAEARRTAAELAEDAAQPTGAPCIQGPHRDERGEQTARLVATDLAGRKTISAGMCERHLKIVADQWRRTGYTDVYGVPLSYLEEWQARKAAALGERVRAAEIRQLGADPHGDAEARRELLDFERQQRAHDREMNVTPGMVKAFQMATRHGLPEDMALQGMTVALFARLLETTKTPELHPVNLDPYPGTIPELADELVRVVVDLEESGAARNLLREVLVRLRAAEEKHAHGPCQECNRPRNGVSKGCRTCRMRHPEQYRHAYGEVEG